MPDNGVICARCREPLIERSHADGAVTQDCPKHGTVIVRNPVLLGAGYPPGGES